MAEKTGLTLLGGLLPQSKESPTVAENRRAQERMTQLCTGLSGLIDSQTFRAQETPFTNQYEGGATLTVYNTTVPAAKPGFTHQVETIRDDQGRATRVSVYTHPDSDYTTGLGDGRWNVSLHSGQKGVEIWESAIQGEHYLGLDTARVIDALGINGTKTTLDLKPVSFGGYPDADVQLQAWGESKGVKVGPIGEIQNVHVLGLARALNVTAAHQVDIASTDVPITSDFDQSGLQLQFPRGDMAIAIKREKTPNHGDVLRVAFSGERQVLKGVGRGGQRLVENQGPEVSEFSLPTSMLNGHTVLDMLTSCVTSLKDAFNQSHNKPALPKPKN